MICIVKPKFVSGNQLRTNSPAAYHAVSLQTTAPRARSSKRKLFRQRSSMKWSFGLVLRPEARELEVGWQGEAAASCLPSEPAAFGQGNRLCLSLSFCIRFSDHFSCRHGIRTAAACHRNPRRAPSSTLGVSSNNGDAPLAVHPVDQCDRTSGIKVRQANG